MEAHKIWIEQCEAARGIEAKFGTQESLRYLIEAKFFNFLEVAERDHDFRAEIPAFVAEIRNMFEPRQLAQCLELASQTEPFDVDVYLEEGDGPDDSEMERRANVHRCAADLPLIARAREWLLE